MAIDQKANSASDIRLVNMSKYVRPKIEENKSKGYVLNGQKNSFFQYIIDRYNGSPTNAAIINSYCDLIYGRGLYSKRADRNTSDWVKFRQVLKPNEIRKIVSDYVLFGEFSFQVITNKGKDLENIYHIPKQKVVPAIANDDEEIESYFYSKDWTNITQNAPEDLPAFSDGKDPISIYVGKPYRAGKDYFADPEYMAGMPYAEMEEEIANYYVSHIKNGLSFGYIINIPDGNSLSDEEKDEFEKKIKAKLVGSNNAGKFVLSFNGRDAEITVTPLTINDAHKQWQYLTGEARQQLLTAHRVTSPMLFGIKDNTGLGNNANELDVAEAQLMKRVIAPKQEFILDALEDVLMQYNINLDLSFKPLSEEAPTVTVDPLIAPMKMSKAKIVLQDLGEDIDEDQWDVLQEIEVDYDEEKVLSLTMASSGTARPNAKSSQDTENIKIRYRYVGNPNPEREFCKVMMSNNKVYRKEDIIMMESMAVNPGWGPEGADTYSIWLYKGGGDCHHKWNRVIYLKKGADVDVYSPLAEIISSAEARREGYKLETNNTLVSVEPRNMTNNGFLKSR